MEQQKWKTRGYKDLIVWNKAMKLVAQFYQVTSAFPKNELFGMMAQMRRASASIPANIAEGQARGSNKQFINFLNISKGSLAELETEILIAQELEFVTTDICKELLGYCSEIGKLLNGLIASLRTT